MPTLNKLEYLDETKGLIKNALNTKFNSGITDEDTFRSYVSKIQNIYTNWPKVTDKGTELSITAKKGKMVLDPYGNTQQDSYSGKNLIGIPDQSFTYNGVDITISNGEITMNGTGTGTGTKNITPIKTTTLNGDYNLNIIYVSGNRSGQGNMNIRNTDGTIIDGTQTTFNVNSNSNRTFNIPSSKSVIYGIYIYTGAIYENYKFKPQLVSGTTADNDWEKFVGGTASPNPDYPQNIRVVTGDNTINIVGKNILNEAEIVVGFMATDGTFQPSVTQWNTTNFIKIKPNTTYNFSWDPKVTGAYWQTRVIYFNNNKAWVSGTDLSSYPSDYNYSITTPANVEYIRISFTNVGNYQRENIMLALGSQKTTYEPYQSQSYSLNLGSIELCKIGDYQDYIYKDNGKWYKHSEIGKIVLDGSETITQAQSSMENTIRYSKYMPNSIELQNITNSSNGYCNQLYIIDGYSLDSEHTYCYNKVLYFFYNKNRIADVNALYTWLETNNLIIYGILATPTNTEITDTTLINQLEALLNVMAKDGTNNISSSYAEGNAPIVLNVTALMKGGN